VRQRLQLAVAVLHEPDILILDEPTSGVDPVARDGFWALLISLSRKDNVTIFISTHFMNEAERCDRISLMHAGKVLAIDSPGALRDARGADTLEDAFISYLEDAARKDDQAPDHAAVTLPLRPQTTVKPAAETQRLSLGRAWAFARREAIEIARDPIRLAFALFGPLVLMLAMGYGISFDVEKLSYAALDRDRSRESRMLLEGLSSSRYFREAGELRTQADLDRMMTAGEISLAVVVPPDFGRDLLAGRQPEIAAWRRVVPVPGRDGTRIRPRHLPRLSARIG
jgi:ribosome-dependent ATPase